MKTSIGLLLVPLVLLSGCRRASAPRDGEPAPPDAIDSAADYVTGAAPIRTGKEAEERIRRITADRDARMQDALDAVDGAEP